MAEVHGHADAKGDGAKHYDGFDDALEAALQRASEGLEPGDHRVKVEFRVHVKVTNPGRIMSYSVSLVPDPS